MRFVIKNILWAIDNRTWFQDKRAYITWIANFFDLLDTREKRKFDESYDQIGKNYGISKDEVCFLKGNDPDYEPPAHEVALSKIGSENFDTQEDFWSKGSYAHSLSRADISEEKMKYFGGDSPNDPKEHQCVKCKMAIGKHNLYWHDGMCDACFFGTHEMQEEK